MYTVKETAQLKELYADGVIIADIAKKLEKSEKSIIGKLVNEGVYVPKAKTSKVTGETIKTKASYVKDIEKILEVELKDLDKAPKTTLVLLKDTLVGWLGD
jgi:ribulose 1,5-bisphosphate carboxylase large subunit-like protein